MSINMLMDFKYIYYEINIFKNKLWVGGPSLSPYLSPSLNPSNAPG